MHLPSPPRAASKSVPQKATNITSPRATSRSQHVQSSTEIPSKNNARRNETTQHEASNLSITSSDVGVVPIAQSPKPAEKVEEKKKKKAKKSKSTAKEKRASTDNTLLPKVEEEDDKSEQSEKSIAQSITESILPFLVKKTKKQDSGTRDNAPAKAKCFEKKMEQNGCVHNDDEDSHQHDDGPIANEAEQSSNGSSKKEIDTSIHQDDDQGEHHHHRRVHAAFRGAPSTNESQLLPEGDSKLDANVPLIDNIKQIETPSNAATLHKVMAALQEERENAFEAKCQLRETLAELDKVKRDFSNSKEAYSTENYRLNNKLMRMMDRIEQLEHEMAMSGKSFIYATLEGEPEYKSVASPSTKYGARSPRAVRLSKIPWACVDTFMNPCSGERVTNEEREDTFFEPTNSFVAEEETEEEDPMPFELKIAGRCLGEE